MTTDSNLYHLTHIHFDDQGIVEFFQDLENKVFTKYLTSYQPKMYY